CSPCRPARSWSGRSDASAPDDVSRSGCSSRARAPSSKRRGGRKLTVPPRPLLMRLLVLLVPLMVRLPTFRLKPPLGWCPLVLSRPRVLRNLPTQNLMPTQQQLQPTRTPQPPRRRL